jgi:hypothetical protein
MARRWPSNIPRLPKKPCPPLLHVVFVWDKDGRYNLDRAIKVYKREHAADAFAEKHFRESGKNYVVRTLHAKTGEQVFNVPAHCQKKRR